MTKKKLAKFISWLFDPPFFAIAILIVAILRSPMTPIETVSWIIGVIVLNAFVPLIFLHYFTAQGLVFDDELKNEAVHRQRIQIFIVFLIMVTLQFILLLCTKQYQPLLAVFTGGIIAITLCIIITYFWKISLHGAMTTFFIAMIIYIYGWQYWPIIFFIPLVGWSRIELNRHTVWQFIAGCALAVAVVVGTFFLYQIV